MTTQLPCTKETHETSRLVGSMLIDSNHQDAVRLLSSLSPIDAVRVVIAATRRVDSVVSDRELDGLGEYLGVFDVEGIDNKGD